MPVISHGNIRDNLFQYQRSFSVARLNFYEAMFLVVWYFNSIGNCVFFYIVNFSSRFYIGSSPKREHIYVKTTFNENLKRKGLLG